LVNPSILWLNPIWTKRGFNQPKIVVFSTWNRGIYQESWSTYETYGDIRKKQGLAHTFYKFRVDDEMSRKNMEKLLGLWVSEFSLIFWTFLKEGTPFNSMANHQF
jgi:hypothetical protein